MPHPMKKKIFYPIVLGLVTLVAVSCDWESVISPNAQFPSELYRSYTMVDSLGQDTLVRDTISYTDSLNVGDTVLMPIVLQGYYHYLTLFKATADTSKVALSLAWDEEYNSFLAEDADPAHGKLSFIPEKVNACVTTLKYIPKASGTHTVEFLLQSTAKEPYSQGAWSFNMAVR